MQDEDVVLEREGVYKRTNGTKGDINVNRSKETEKRRESNKCFTPSLNFSIGETSDPQAPFDDTLHGFELIFCAGINQTKETLDDTRCRTIALEVN